MVGGKYADKHVPAHIRRLLSAECGCNDGAAYPFLFLALYLILDSTPGRAVEDWFLYLWLCKSFASVFGCMLMSPCSRDYPQYSLRINLGLRISTSRQVLRAQ